MHGEGGAAAGVAVEFRQDDARDAEGLVEMLRDGDGLLTEGGIADENDFVRLDFGLQIDELLDEIVVDLQTAGGIQDDGIQIVKLRVGDGAAGDRVDVFRLAIREDIDAELLREDFDLVDGGGSVEVAADEQRLAFQLVLQMEGQFCGRRRLTGAMETAEHDDGWFRDEIQRLVVLAQQGGQLVVDDFDGELSGRDGIHDGFAEALLGDVRDEFLGDGVVHVGVKQGGADFGHCVLDVGFREFTAAGQVSESRFESVSKVVEHRSDDRGNVRRETRDERGDERRQDDETVYVRDSGRLGRRCRSWLRS